MDLRQRALAAMAVVVLAAVGAFGNGVYGTHFQATFSWGVLAPDNHGRVPRIAVEEALRIALSAPFLRYASVIDPQEVAVMPEAMRRSLTIHQVPCATLASRRIQVTPAPPAEAHCLILEHYDAINHGLSLLGTRRAALNARARFAQELALRYLPELAALEVYRSATDDTTRLRSLRFLRPNMPHLAEWDAREIDRFLAATPPPSPDVRAALEATRAHLALYLRDPTLRGLPRGFRAALH